jgi:hypothetical protein
MIAREIEQAHKLLEQHSDGPRPRRAAS